MHARQTGALSFRENPYFSNAPELKLTGGTPLVTPAGDLERVMIIDRNASLSADHTLAEIVFVLGLVRALRRPPLANSPIGRQRLLLARERERYVDRQLALVEWSNALVALFRVL